MSVYMYLGGELNRTYTRMDVFNFMAAFEDYPEICENAEVRHERRCSRIIRRWFTIEG